MDSAPGNCFTMILNSPLVERRDEFVKGQILPAVAMASCRFEGFLESLHLVAQARNF
jgi:hypothetical protein